MKKVWKKCVALFFTAAMVMSLAACGSSKGDVAEGAETENTKPADAATDTEQVEETDAVQEFLGETPLDPANEYFGISLPMTSSEYYKGVETELTQYCEQFGIKYDLASADSDTQKQLTQFENFMTMGCTTIVVYPLDLTAMQDIMKKAVDDGIRVVSATMTPADIGAYTIAIDASQDAVGTAVAQYASEWIDEHYPDAPDGSVEVALFTMSISENIIERCDGLRKIEDFNSKAKIVVDYDVPVENYMVKVKENADLMMQQYPDVKVILTYSDVFNIIIDEAMMANPDIDTTQICSVAVDKTNAVMEKIKLSKENESTIRATVATGENFNLTLVQASLGAFDDQLNDKKQYFVEPFIINADNVESYMQ